MNYSFKDFFADFYREQGQKYAFCAGDEQEFMLWKEGFRNALKEQLGMDVLERIGARGESRAPVLLSESREEGYICRKYVLETLPAVFMPFYMLIPDGGRARAAMITIPAHGANKNTVCGIAENEEEAKKVREAPDECYGRVFAQKGYVVFCPDPPGYGERAEPMPLEETFFSGPKERTSLDCSCKDLAQTAEVLGLSFTALELWELQRLLDFACDCPEVLREKSGPLIGCAGFSGGGQYSMWLGAMDDRIRICVVSGYVHGYLDSLLDCHLCPCNYAPGLWKLGDISDICSLIAPRPLFVENGTEDVENGPLGIEGPKNQVEKIKKAYQIFGRKDLPEHSTPEGPHRWYGGCYEFVDKYLVKLRNL